jgi:hypothetical protein
MKKTFAVLILAAFMTSLSGQEEGQSTKSSNPVRFTFGTGLLIENQTIETPYKSGLELEIIHRFSTIQDIHDLYGIYGAANTRLGLNYGITDRLMVGLGTTKDYHLQDLEWKYLILRQTDDNSMPVSLSYYGNIVFDFRNKQAFGSNLDAFKEIHRMSYFTQLIIARKFGERISLQVAPSVVYYNAVERFVDSTGYVNLNFGLSAGFRANLFGSHSLIVEYDQILNKQDGLSKDLKPKPNIAFGWEIGTATHTFQVFVTKYNQIINQRNLVYNTNKDFLVGFNITVRF